jgi:5-methylcytosine-specific restriction endonuclease McrA
METVQEMLDSSWIPSFVLMMLLGAVIMVMISRHTTRVRERASADARRSRLLNDMPSELRFRVYERDSFTCQRCGTESDLQVDFLDDPPDDDQLRLNHLVTRCARCAAIVHQSGIIG